MLKPWKILDSSATYEDQWLKLRSDRCITKAGKIIEPFHILEYPTWVNVVALTKNEKIILVRQYRHGVVKILTELPCGIT